MENNKGFVKQEGVNFYFQPAEGEKIKVEIGYVKYAPKIDTNVDVGFVDYYPVTDFLLAKLHEEQTLCELEVKNGSVYTINDKLVLII